MSLGLLGGGGSILAVPILVYVVGMAAKPAIATSLIVVGTTSLIGSIQHLRAANVDIRTALIFGIVSMAGSYTGGRFASLLSDSFQLGFFAFVMIAASIAMFRSTSEGGSGSRTHRSRRSCRRRCGASDGDRGSWRGLSDRAGARAGCRNSDEASGGDLARRDRDEFYAAAYVAYSEHVSLDWKYTAAFTACALAGVLAGSAMIASVPQRVLKRAFAMFIAGIGTFILIEIVTRGMFG
jgi:uncharacterized protein